MILTHYSRLLNYPDIMTGKADACRIPGWSSSVQPLKDKALMRHRIWTEIGRPHEGTVQQ